MPSAHDGTHALLRFDHSLRVRCLHDHGVDHLRLRIEQLAHRRAPWRDHEVVERDPEDAAPRLGHRDHAVGHATHAELATDRVESAKGAVDHVRADDQDVLALREFLVGEGTAVLERDVLDREPVAVHADRVGAPGARVATDDLHIGLGLERPARSLGERLDHRQQVADVEPRPATILLPDRFVDVADVDVGATTQLERVHGEQLADEIVLHVLAHPVDDRDDGDEEHHADANAREGEEALELLDPERLEGEPDGFEERHLMPPSATGRASR